MAESGQPRRPGGGRRAHLVRLAPGVAAGPAHRRAKPSADRRRHPAVPAAEHSRVVPAGTESGPSPVSLIP